MKQKSFKMDEVKQEDKGTILFLQFFLIFLIVCGGIMSIYYGFAKKDRYNIIFYEKGNADYKVYLKPNEYYSSPYLEKGMSYIANLIDKIEVNFNYNLNSSRESELKYKYKISADLVITERGQENKILYSKPIDLKDEVSKIENTSGLINETIIINYDDYNAMVNNYKKEYSLSISSKLVIKMHIDSASESVNMNKDNFNSSNDLIVSIPLSEQTLEINFNHNEINNSKEIVEYSSFNPINYIYLFIGLILIISGVVFFFKALTKKSKKNKISKYEKIKNNLLKEYDRFIVEASKMNNFEANKIIINVKSFVELLDARENTDNPIIFYEDKNEKLATFMVIDNNNVFIYRISEKEFAENENMY